MYNITQHHHGLDITIRPLTIMQEVVCLDLDMTFVMSTMLSETNVLELYIKDPKFFCDISSLTITSLA
jgi:hypothetical protein